MSFARGDLGRSRPQKHQNKTVFKNDLHDNSTKIKKLNAMSISEVCTHCSEVIQWKIKYRKYKPLTKPRACTRCNQRNVKKAYHVLCRDCALALKQCAKCFTSSETSEVIPPEPSTEEKIRLDLEMKQLIKSLSERKRRTFLRFMHGKKNKRKNKGNVLDELDDQEEDDEIAEERPRRMRTRDELLNKLEQLKARDDKDGDDFYDDINSSDDEEDDDDDDWISENDGEDQQKN